MYIYLPIAEMPVNIILILVLGLLSGILSGMFGIGGGFIVTPCLMFLGIPPTVAVSSSSNQIVAASFSGFIVQLRRANVDIKIGTVITTGALVGSAAGVWLFKILNNFGKIDSVISISYIILLSFVGIIMFYESINTIRSKKKNTVKTNKKRKHLKLPFEMDFPYSNIKISVLVPLILGILTGVLVSIMGIGGGFIMIPAMIYLLKMPTSIAIGTSLFQVTFTAASVTVLQALTNNTVDIVLALLMLSGSIFGVQIGTKIGIKSAPEYLRGLLGAIALLVSIKLILSLFIVPESLYSVIHLDK